MQILILSWRGPKHPNWGGAEIVTHEHAKAWAKAGHNVTLLTSGFPGVPTEEIIDGVQIIRRGNQIATIQIAAIYWYLFSNHPKYDLVVDQFHGIPFFTPLYVSSKKLAFIHEVAKEVWWSNHLSFPVNYIYGCVGYLLEPLIFLLYRNIPFMTVSESTRQDLINWSIPEKNITVVHNGFTPISVKENKESTPTLIFLGAIARDKGIEEALVVFSKLDPVWKFWVVGKGEPHYLSRLNIGSRVKFWGFVDEGTKFKLLARAHIMLNTSHREGWGLVNIEANSVGTPVVAYDVPGCRDSIQNHKTGMLCQAGDIECLVRAITNLMDDTLLYQKISRQAKLWSQTFSWDRSTHASLNLLYKINPH